MLGSPRSKTSAIISRSAGTLGRPRSCPAARARSNSANSRSPRQLRSSSRSVVVVATSAAPGWFCASATSNPIPASCSTPVGTPLLSSISTSAPLPSIRARRRARTSSGSRASDTAGRGLTSSTTPWSWSRNLRFCPGSRSRYARISSGTATLPSGSRVASNSWVMCEGYEFEALVCERCSAQAKAREAIARDAQTPEASLIHSADPGSGPFKSIFPLLASTHLRLQVAEERGACHETSANHTLHRHPGARTRLAHSRLGAR